MLIEFIIIVDFWVGVCLKFKFLDWSAIEGIRSWMYLNSMINVSTDIVIARISWPFSTRDWMVIHFGINPRRGGSPPILIRFINIINFLIGLFLIIKGSCIIWKEFICLKRVIMLIEIKE